MVCIVRLWRQRRAIFKGVTCWMSHVEVSLFRRNKRLRVESMLHVEQANNPPCGIQMLGNKIESFRYLIVDLRVLHSKFFVINSIFSLFNLIKSNLLIISVSNVHFLTWFLTKVRSLQTWNLYNCKELMWLKMSCLKCIEIIDRWQKTFLF